MNKLTKLTWAINIFSWFKIPLLAYVRPKVVELNDSQAVVRIKLNGRSRNHLNVMYFGALAMGAELSIAVMAVSRIKESKKRIDFLFKDFSSNFLKRTDGHAFFVCPDSKEVKKLIDDATKTKDRLEKTFSGFAYVDPKTKEPVMTYKLTLSVKNRSKS